jgi:hypothetical protein
MINTIRYSSEMTGIEGYGITYKTQYMLDDGTWADMGSGGSGMEVNTDELVTNINFAPDKPYTTRIVLTDMFTTYEARSSISNTFTEINICENGVGLGTLAQPGKLTVKKEWLGNLIHPIGSIYMSTVFFDPSEIFGGTWEQVKDRMLIGAGGSYQTGSTGGSATITIAQKNLPDRVMVRTNDKSDSACNTSVTVNSGYNNHALFDAKLENSKPINSLPPYLAAFIWRRIG